MMNYLVVAESGILSNVKIFDFEKQVIIRLQRGTFEDITDACKKLTKKKSKVLGGQWYRFLTGEIDHKQACIFAREIQLSTDDRAELDKLILDIQKQQIEFMLKNCNATISKMQKGNQYYTYCWSNS